jgi:hypothetical protein
MPPHLFVLLFLYDRAEAPHQRNNKTNKCGGMIVQRPLTKEITKQTNVVA